MVIPLSKSITQAYKPFKLALRELVRRVITLQIALVENATPASICFVLTPLTQL
ncbi:MAG: hypothetical protein ACJAWQ_000648 [Paraglaciecola sp.]|jgi:hypothetical protein